MQYSTVVKECVELAIKNQAGKVVNKYCDFWNTDPSKYKLTHLDTLYHYLIWAHKKKTVDIFDYNPSSLFHTLFLIGP